MTMPTYISTTEAAKRLGISRIAVFKKIQQGHIKAHKVGRNFVIDEQLIGHNLEQKLDAGGKRTIDAAVKKVVREYGKTLKLLGQE